MQVKDAARIIGRVGLLLPLILIFLTADSAFACPGHSKAAHRTRVNTRTVSYMPGRVITYRAPVSYQRCASTGLYTQASYVPTRVSGNRYVAVRGSKGYTAGTKYVSDVRYNFGRQRYGAVYDVDYGDARRFYSPRYVAVRKVAVESPRYVTVRRSPMYVERDVRYVAVQRQVPRTRYVAVRHVEIEDDDEDDMRYVAVRRHKVHDQGSRYVMVRNGYNDVNRAKYVAVRNTDNGCMRKVALRSCLDQIETTSTRRVVRGNGYSNNTRHVAVREEMDDDDDHIALPAKTKYVAVRKDFDDDDDVEYVTSPSSTKYVTVRDDDDDDDEDDEFIRLPRNRSAHVVHSGNAYYDNDGDTYIAVKPNTRTISYAAVPDDDYEDRAILDGSDATYVVDEDAENAYLSTEASPQVVSTQAVSYVPADELDTGYSIQQVSGSRFVVNGNAPPHSIPYVAMDEDGLFDDVDPEFVASHGLDTQTETAAYVPVEAVDEVDTEAVSYVPVNHVDEIDTENISYVPVAETNEVMMQPVAYMADDEMDCDTVSYVPARTMHARTVSYVPADNHFQTVSYVPVKKARVRAVGYVSADDMHEMVSYVPVNDMHETVSYVPVSHVDDVETTLVADAACPMMVSRMNAQPVYVANSSTVFVDELDNGLLAGLNTTQRIAGRYGYRDGFEDGQEAALEGDVYHPENSGDYQKATEGYEDDYGDKDVYKDSYRSSYLAGYRAGFASGNAG